MVYIHNILRVPCLSTVRRRLRPTAIQQKEGVALKDDPFLSDSVVLLCLPAKLLGHGHEEYSVEK